MLHLPGAYSLEGDGEGAGEVSRGQILKMGSQKLKGNVRNCVQFNRIILAAGWIIRTE